MSVETKELELDGPSSYINWLAFKNKVVLKSISEFPLYTDARIIGEITQDFGPYKLLNTVPITDGPGVLQTSIVLRVELYLGNELPQMKETDTSNYHGGWLPDEMAALVSLCMGIRVKAGDESRRFDIKGDPLGSPQAFRFRNEPTMSLGDKRLKLPNAVGSHSLEKLEPIKLLPKLSSNEVVAAIRAARLYQDALWIGESEPALAWVMFVSALETGANIWQAQDDTPISKLESSKPELFKILSETGITELPEKVAEQIVPSLGATNKFIKFVLEYLPDPPDNRPPDWAQIPWSKTAMKKALSKIYGYRSNALHGGIPFPAPMCRAEHVIEGTMSEKPTGLASHTLGGTWVAEDTPMLIHMFEFITRGVLLNWLNDLTMPNKASQPTPKSGAAEL